MLFRRKTLFDNPGLLDPPVTKFRKARESKNIGVDLAFNNAKGIFHTNVTNTQQVLSNLKNLLLTMKGERYLQPEFGTNIKKILFENITSEQEFSDSLRVEVESAIETWLPYLSVTELQVRLNTREAGLMERSDHAVEIYIRVKIVRTNIYLPIRLFISDTATMRIVEDEETGLMLSSFAEG